MMISLAKPVLNFVLQRPALCAAFLFGTGAILALLGWHFIDAMTDLKVKDWVEIQFRD